MMNLTEDSNRNLIIRKELTEAGIQIACMNQMTDRVSCPIVFGILNGFKFMRAQHYWIVTGNMPLREAEYIYNNYKELGIRCAGHCANPSPHDWAEPLDYDEYMNELQEQIHAKKITYDDSEQLLNEYKKGKDLFIKSYHVDTMEGLVKLADIIREHDITTELCI